MYEKQFIKHVKSNSISRSVTDKGKGLSGGIG